MNYTAVAHAAGVSRTWLYRQDQLSDIIGDLRKHEPPAATITAQRASANSLRQRLDTACAEITRLRTENHSLREQIARQIGLHRMQPATKPRRPAMTRPPPLPKRPRRRHVYADRNTHLPGTIRKRLQITADLGVKP